MATDLTKTLRKALGQLEAEKERISRQIATIRTVLAAGDTVRPRGRDRATARGKRRRTAMSAAARKAVSRRMKEYWATRRAEAAKGKREGGK